MKVEIWHFNMEHLAPELPSVSPSVKKDSLNLNVSFFKKALVNMGNCARDAR